MDLDKQFILKLVKFGDTVDLMIPPKHIELKINETVFYVDEQHLRKISKKAYDLPSDASRLAINVDVDEKFIEMVIKAIAGHKDVEITIRDLSNLSLIWNELQIDGSLEVYYEREGKIHYLPQIQYIEREVINLANDQNLRRVIAFASKLNLNELAQTCFKILYNCGYNILRAESDSKPQTRLNVSLPVLEKLLADHNARLNKRDPQSESTFLGMEEVEKLIEVQLEVESDLWKRAEDKKEVFTKYMDSLETTERDKLRILRAGIRCRDEEALLHHTFEGVQDLEEKIKSLENAVM